MIKYYLIALGLLGCIFAGQGLDARVFDFNSESVAVYLRGTGGMSSVKQDPFIHIAGDGSLLSQQYDYNVSGEFGLLMGLGPAAGLRFGFEILRPTGMSETAVNAGGERLYDLKSRLLVINPNLQVEYYFKRHPQRRFLFMVGTGYGEVSLSNEFVMTSTGESQLGASFSEKSSVRTVNASMALGFETLLTNTVTLAGEFGYRYFPVTGLKLTAPSRDVSEGSDVLNDDGSPRKFNLGGLYLGVSLRFFIDLI